MSYLDTIKQMSDDVFLEHIISYVVLIVAIIIFIYFIVVTIRDGNIANTECQKMNSLYPSLNNTIRPINNNDPVCRKKLKEYYVKTAYNACSGGDYKNDYVDICNLMAVIRQGVRCLDFEIYSVNNQPIVSTSTIKNFHVKETYDSVPFSTVMSTIQNYAFASGTCPNYTDPLFIHLRIKSKNQRMYENLSRIFQTYSNRMLGSSFSYNASSGSLANASLLSLQNKIIVIVSKENTDFMNNAPLMEFVNMLSNSIEMRMYRYKYFENNMNNIDSKNELETFNKSNMTIVLPNNGNLPDNPDAKLCRKFGCQFVAMIFQQPDEQLREYNSFFDRAGYAFAPK